MAAGKHRKSERALRPPMRSPGRPPVARREHRQRFWREIARGLASEDAAVAAGVFAGGGNTLVPRWWRDVINPFYAALGSLSVVRRAGRDRALECSELRRACHRPEDRSVAVDDLARAASKRCDPRW